MTQKNPEASRLAPAESNGWKAAAEDRLFQGRQLYEYIDGGAELYISYGFKYLFSRTYTRPGQPGITLDLFDMGRSQDAFGVFSQSREKIERDAGQGSEYAAGQMIFWKDRYYISIMGQGETVELKKAVFEMAGKISNDIPGEGPLPTIIERLPGKDLVPESVRYFHHYVWLNSHYYIADRNILRINKKTDAILAKYGRGMKRTVLLVVEYADEKEMELARADFMKHFLPDAAGRRAVRIEDGTWTACGSRGRHLAVVFSATAEAKALRLIDDALMDRK